MLTSCLVPCRSRRSTFSLLASNECHSFVAFALEHRAPITETELRSSGALTPQVILLVRICSLIPSLSRWKAAARFFSRPFNRATLATCQPHQSQTAVVGPLGNNLVLRCHFLARNLRPSRSISSCFNSTIVSSTIRSFHIHFHYHMQFRTSPESGGQNALIVS